MNQNTVMEEEQTKEVGSYIVSLEDEGGECCVQEEDVEVAMVLDNQKEYLGVGVVEPTLGMEFTSEEDARNFYNAYAKQTGFSIRVNSYYRSKKDNSIISREFCCSKEGFRRERCARRVDSGDDAKRRRARPITREGCKALMTVRKRDDGKWYVAKLEKSHNHELVTPAMRHFLRSHKSESCPNKSLSNSFESPRLNLNASLNALAEDGNSFGKVPFAVQTNVNYIGKGRLSTFGIDAQSLLGFFKIMQASDPAFYYAIQVDEEDRLSSVFWVETRSRIAYSCFSDVVAFDTTYQVNQYKMPFAPFTGVNHHKQSVLFGCALLADETESTFIWLFTSWLEAMSGQQPGLIITDYDSAISRAVHQVFPRSSHRYCKWHIMSKTPKEMGLVYGTLPRTFQVEFDRCINKNETPDEFESAWHMLLDKYNLRGNDRLQSLYVDRKLWVPILVRDTFFAGMYAAQRGGSVSSLFDGYVNARTTLQDFAEQYEMALSDRYEKESKAEFETFYSKPVLKTPLPVEKQAAEVYTRKMFSTFQDEVFESLALAVKLSGEVGEDNNRYEVARFDEEHRVYMVDFNITEQIASCSCKMFEFEGIVCRHVLAVFKATNVFTLPQRYILKRWTRNAKDEATLDTLPSVEMQGNSQKGKNLHYSILYQEAIKCAEEGLASDHIFKVALNALREARINIISAKKNAMNAPKLDTKASTSRGDDTTITSQVDSSSLVMSPLDHQRDKTRESSEENNMSKYVLEQSSSGVNLCSNCKCPGHDRSDCLWLKDSGQKF